MNQFAKPPEFSPEEELVARVYALREQFASLMAKLSPEEREIIEESMYNSIAEAKQLEQLPDKKNFLSRMIEILQAKITFLEQGGGRIQ